jgi:hypothetical protein
MLTRLSSSDELDELNLAAKCITRAFAILPATANALRVGSALRGKSEEVKEKYNVL